MIWLLLLCLSMIGGHYAQTTCIRHVPPSSGRVVLTYTPYVTPQIAPTSTVYRHIVTAWTYAVDCRYVSLSQVDDNQPASGPFTGTPTTVDALTITRIGCIQQTSAITRRDMIRGFPAETPIAVEGRLEKGTKDHAIQKRASLKEGVVEVAAKLADDIPPDAQGISVKAYSYLVQVNTALYALNLYNTGFNMSVTCTLLNDPVTQARLLLASVNPVQAEAIICYAAQYGLFFDMSNAQLLSDLLSIIYSIEVKSGFTNNSTVICDSLRLRAAGFLGIDTQGIQSYVCGDQLPSNVTANQSSTSQIVTGTGFPGTAGSGRPTITTAGQNPPFANTTSPVQVNDTALSTAIGGTGKSTIVTTSPLPSGTGVPVTISNGTLVFATTRASGDNSSSSRAAPDSFSIVFPNATAAVDTLGSDGGNLPPSPTASPYYAVWTTSTTTAAHLPRY